IRQNSFYSNLIYNSILSNTMHKFATGISLTYDGYDELVTSSLDGTTTIDFSRKDNSVGTFFEYTYDNTDNFSLVAGIRLDNHNRLRTLVTPIVHSRYNPWKRGTLKANIRRRIRNANIFAENQYLFASSRKFNISSTGGKIYGLDPEIAWNYGVSLMQNFNLFSKKAEIIVDF